MSAASFVAIETVHEAEVAWWWTDDKLHDSSYTVGVNDSVAEKVMQLSAKYGVSEDRRHCCQWEGILLRGADLQNVTAAANELARHLARFKGVRPLDA